MNNKTMKYQKLSLLLMMIFACFAIVFSTNNLLAQNKTQINKTLETASWLKIPLANSNELEGGHHVYQTWDDYNDNMVASRAMPGMMITILDSDGNGNMANCRSRKDWSTSTTTSPTKSDFVVQETVTRIESDASIDFDDLTTEGKYKCDSNDQTNGPDNLWDEFVLEVVDLGSYTYQRAEDVQGNVYTRVKNGDTWDEWKSPANQIPSGLIFMWNGSIDNIPAGWALCDGTNGTPDLRNRFIVGAGSSYNIGDTGGQQSVTLTTEQMPSHSHFGTTNSNGSHSHSFKDYYWSEVKSVDDKRSDSDGWKSEDISDKGIGGQSTDHDNDRMFFKEKNTGSVGSHTHTITVDKTGGGSSHENRPPYYALAFIMKL